MAGGRSPDRHRRAFNAFPTTAMDNRHIHRVIARVRQQVRRWPTPAVGIVAHQSRDPFRVLVSCILSLRTKDNTTARASQRLFSLANTPRELVRLPIRSIERAIYPVGFYRTKARVLRNLSRDLLERFEARVPDEMDALLSMKGVGRKTANLVLTLGFQKPGICVDTHVHRITNRWGYVRTRNPNETEAALRRKLPARYWREFNDLLVPYGQNLCRPVSPICSRCPVAQSCAREGVQRSR